MRKPVTSEKPAGGRGAIAASLNAFRKQDIPLKVLGSFWHANKVQGGFDCPGCAFPDKPDCRGLDSCEQGQKAIAWEMTRKAAGASFFDGKTPEQLRALSDLELESHGRLTTPVLYERRSNQYRAIDWDSALDIAARELRALDPHAVAFYASGRSSNEAAFLWQLLARSYGSPHLPDSSNFCHEPSGHALKQSIGIGKGTCQLEDFEQADLFIVMGQNPASNHPRMMAALYAARQRGAKVLVLNPIAELAFRNFSDPKNVAELIGNRGIAVANAIYRLRIGGDLAAIQGVMKALFEAESKRPGEVLDHAFMREHCEGLEALRASVDALHWRDIEAESGLDAAHMREIADFYAKSKACMLTWCMGLTHHPRAVETIQQVANLALLRGNVGKLGAGLMPVRGHSNVQGDRTMGATSQVSARWLDNQAACFPGVQLNRDRGRDAAGVLEGLFDGSMQALLSLGGNFGVAAPDVPRVLDALSSCRFTLHIATKLNRTHCHPGAVGLLLPTLGRTDKDLSGGRMQSVSTEDTSSTVRVSRGVQSALSEGQLSEPMIVARLAHAMAATDAVPWLDLVADYDRIRDAIEYCQRGVTDGFDDYSKRLHADGRFRLPNSAAHRRWATASGRAHFHAAPLHRETPLSRARQQHGPAVMVLMTIRAHDQFNTTVYSNDDRYRGVAGNRRVLFANADDLAQRGLKEGDSVAIESLIEDGIVRRVDDFRLRAIDIARGCLAAYFPEAGALVPASHYSADTRTPIYKEVPVRIVRS